MESHYTVSSPVQSTVYRLPFIIVSNLKCLVRRQYKLMYDYLSVTTLFLYSNIYPY